MKRVRSKPGPQMMQKLSGGKRHTNGLGGPGDLNAHIEESRIYSVALTEDEVNEMEIGTLSVDPQGKLATRWAKLKTK